MKQKNVNLLIMVLMIIVFTAMIWGCQLTQENSVSGPGIENTPTPVPTATPTATPTYRR